MRLVLKRLEQDYPTMSEHVEKNLEKRLGVGSAFQLCNGGASSIVFLRTQRGLYLECSHFIPKLKERKKEWQKMPVQLPNSVLDSLGLVAMFWLSVCDAQRLSA